MRLAATLLCVVVVFPLAGCFGGEPSSSSSSSSSTTTSSSNGGLDTVTLRDNFFDNGNRSVSIGTATTFRNDGAHAHTVTIHHVGDPLSGTLLNQTLQPGQTTIFTFVAKGTYHVWCRFHGTMTTGMAMVMTVP
ncbi:MAG: hypothetical protein V4510_08735 [bacterium]